MKSTGIVRGMDALGRIVLPKELRDTLRLDRSSKLEIFVDGETILLKKHQPEGACEFCGEVDPDAKVYNGRCICSACREKIGKL